MPRRHHHTFAWKATKAIEHAAAARPLLSRTGPAWVFGVLGLLAESVMAPVIVAATVGVGLLSYLVLDTPWAHIRAGGRPRFVSVRILYLNTLIVAGFWLAVMFTFSAADPLVSAGVEQRLPRLLELATARDLTTLITLKNNAAIPVEQAVGQGSTWFDVFLHGLVCAIALNLLLYGIVMARRRLRGRQARHRGPRQSLKYDASVGLFVDEDSSVAR